MNRLPCTGFWRSLVRLLAGLGLTLLAIAAAAQSDGEPSSSAGAPISVVPEVEREALRRTLAEPMPEGATPAVLRRHFERLAEAARRLSEPAAAEALYRSAMERLPQDAYWPNQLAWQMRDAGRLDEALQLFERASQLAGSPPTSCSTNPTAWPCSSCAASRRQRPRCSACGRRPKPCCPRWGQASTA